MAVVGDTVLLSRHAIAGAELQVVHHAPQRFEERLLMDAPSQGQRGEGAPAVGLSEAGGTVPAEAETQEIARREGIVEAAIVRQQHVTLVVSGRRCLLFLRVGVVQFEVGGVGVFPILIVVAHGDVDVALDVFEVFVVVEVDRCEAVGVLLRAVVVVAALGQVVLVGRRRHEDVAFAPRIVESQGDMGVEFGQEVEAVVGIQAPHIAPHVARGMVVFEQSQRVGRGTGDGHAVGIGRLVISEERFLSRTDGREGAVGGPAPERERVGEAVVAARGFGVDDQFQVIVEQRGREREASRVPGHVVGAQNAVLVAVAERQAVRQEAAQLAGYTYIIVGAEGLSVDHVVPIGVDIGVEQRLLGVRPLRVHQVVHLSAAHHGGRPGPVRHRVGRGEADAGAARCGPFLGRDEDDAIGSARSVDGGGGRILEDCHVLDVVRIDQRQEVAAATDARAHLHGHAVEHDERVVAGIERSSAADADGASGRRRAAAADDLHAAHLAVDELFGRIDHALVEVLAAHVAHRAREVALALHAIADDDHLAERAFPRWRQSWARSPHN